MKKFFNATVMAVVLSVPCKASTLVDSLALENDKGKLYVIHKVEKDTSS